MFNYYYYYDFYDNFESIKSFKKNKFIQITFLLFIRKNNLNEEIKYQQNENKFELNLVENI